jgi:opacity protein-like surface antigen
VRRGMQALGLSLMLAAAAPAAAEEGDVVIGIGGSFTGERFKSDAENLGDVDDSRSWTGQIGYRLNDYLAFELEYERITKFDVSDEVSFAGLTVRRDGEVDGWMAGINAKLYPLQTGRLRPYLMGGIGYLQLDVDFDDSVDGFGTFDGFSGDEKGAVVQVGLGVDLQLTDNWFVELEGSYKFPQADSGDFALKDFQFFTVGGSIQFRF